MRLYVFKSESNPELRAYSDDQSGVKLPARFKPWRAFGAIAANNDPPHGFSRERIEEEIRTTGFQLWRMKQPS
jgi:hypothetical protein